MKKINKIGLILLSAIALSSCVKQNNYPLGPVITYKEFVVNSNGSATVQITFTDGYGTIGYKGIENPPYNFYIELFKDSSNIIVPITGCYSYPALGDTCGYAYNVPYITQSGLEKGLSGQIQIVLGAGVWDPYTNITYVYRMWLIDAGGHISNRVWSNPVPVQ